MVFAGHVQLALFVPRTFRVLSIILNFHVQGRAVLLEHGKSTTVPALMLCKVALQGILWKVPPRPGLQTSSGAKLVLQGSILSIRTMTAVGPVPQVQHSYYLDAS